MDKLSSVLGNGFTALISSTNKKMGFFWLFFFILSVGGCFYLISKSIIDYKNYEFITNIKINYERELEFPAVTLCPQNFKTPDNLYILDYRFDGGNLSHDSIEKVFVNNNGSSFPCLRFNGKNTSSSKELLKTKMPSHVGGIHLIFFTHNESYPGVATYVHGNTIAPLFFEDILIPPADQLSAIIIEKTIQTSLSAAYSDCINENVLKENFFFI